MVLKNDNEEMFHSNAKTIVRLLTKKTRKLNICHINSQSLMKKIDEFRDMFDKSGIDIICVSETWFNCNTSYSSCILNGFKLMLADRRSRRGGVAIYVKSCISTKFICKSDDSEIEYLFIELSSGQGKVLVGVVYRPYSNILHLS